MEENSKVPKIRFKGFNSEWEQRKVGELLEERNIQTPKSDKYPLMAFIQNQGVAPKGDRYNRDFLVNDVENKKYKQTEKGDFIYSSNNLETGSIGLNNYGNAVISPVYSIFKPTGIADSDFIGSSFQRKKFINEMIKWRQGVVYGQWKIHESDFIQIETMVPNLNEQRKIGKLLYEIDNLINLHQRKYDKLVNMKKSMLEKMLPNNSSNTPEIRFKGFNSEWEQHKFEDYGSVSMCKRIFKNETSDNGDIPFYKIGTFGNQADAFISKEKYEFYKSKFSYPRKGDILLSASGTIGRIVEYNGEKAYFQDSNIVWLNHNDSIKNSFLKVLYPIVKWDGIEGSTIKRLYNSNFLNTEFKIPNVNEQEKIGNLFNNIDNLITLYKCKYDKLVNMKKSLLEKMFI